MATTVVGAEPEGVPIDPDRTALLMIDMQRDFLEPGGFGETLGNNVSLLIAAVAPCKSLLNGARKRGMLIVHTREGHRPDLSDAPKAKLERGAPSMRIGANRAHGQDLGSRRTGTRHHPGSGARPDEPVVDKPGKGAFYATDLQSILQNRQIDSLIVCGVTTEVCVHTTVREANDRGYRCVVPGDCCGSYFPEFHEVGLRMIKAQGAIFGWVTDSAKV
jgi:nicotinamidase-related amidase